MRLRTTLAFAMATAIALPVTGAGAGHCDSQIYLFTAYRQQTDVEDPTNPGRTLAPGNPSYQSAVVGCVVVAEDFPETEWDDSNTDYIYPGSNSFSVRWLEGELPAFGKVEFAGETYELTFTKRYNLPVAQLATELIDSQTHYFPVEQSFDGGEAVITVCRDEARQDCSTRTYRTIDGAP